MKKAGWFLFLCAALCLSAAACNKNNEGNKSGENSKENNNDSNKVSGECEKGKFGPDCQPCTCKNGTCNDGKEGSGECVFCENGYYGKNCENKCECNNLQTCIGGPNGTGCQCKNGGNASDCSDQFSDEDDFCLPNTFGPDCQPCTCVTANGFCDDGKEGGGACLSCYFGYYGANCEHECDCADGEVCNDDITGIGCKCSGGFTGNDCSTCSLTEGQKGTFTDPRDSHEYATVVINCQVWLAENLAYAGQDVGCDASTDDADFVNKYGCLYLWESAKKACPTGWHLPSKMDLNELINYLYVDEEAETDKYEQAFLALIKAAAWQEEESSTATGFDALPAGSLRYFFEGGELANKYSVDFGEGAEFWSSDVDDLNATTLSLWLGEARAVSSSYKNALYSVRCIKN